MPAAASADFEQVFEKLRDILRKYEKRLVLKTDAPGNYYLDTPAKRVDGYVIFFGAAQVKKNYVSFHLMPIYGSKDLLESLSPELKARMQGKACFNFKKVEPALFKELAAVTKRGFEVFQRGGYIPAEGKAART
jgi:hypothetical protein